MAENKEENKAENKLGLNWAIKWVLLLIIIFIAIILSVVLIQTVSPLFFWGGTNGALVVVSSTGDISTLLQVMLGYLTLLIAAGSIFGYIFIKDSTIKGAKELVKETLEDLEKALEESEKVLEESEKALEGSKEALKRVVEEARDAVDKELTNFAESNAPEEPEGNAPKEPETKEPRYFIVNTGKKFFHTAQEYMLTSRQAFAFGTREDALKNIKEGDKVFLYGNGEGVVGFGVVEKSGVDINFDFGDGVIKAKGVQMKEADFQRINTTNKPLSYYDIRVKANAGIIVARVCSSVSKQAGVAIENLIEERWTK